MIYTFIFQKKRPSENIRRPSHQKQFKTKLKYLTKVFYLELLLILQR